MATLDDVLTKVKAQGQVIDAVTAEVNDFKAKTNTGQADVQAKVDAVAAALDENAAKLAALVPPPQTPATPSS
jgi:uncharacterized protein YoxC